MGDQNWTKSVAVCVFGRRSSGHPSAMPKRGASGAMVRAVVRGNVAVSRWRSADGQGARAWLGVSQTTVWDNLQLFPADGSEHLSVVAGWRFGTSFRCRGRGGEQSRSEVRFGTAHRVRDLVLSGCPICSE